MDLNRIINMIINTLLRRAVNGVVNKGIGYASKRGRSDAPSAASDDLDQQSRDALKRARQAAKASRRL